ncbi:MAG: S66 peptidase family protein [Planctomycetota bacterium]
MEALLPKALRKGDKIAVVSPASPLAEGREQDLENGLARLRDRGFRPVVAEHALHRTGYLAGTDADRAADLQRAFEDRSIRGIFCVRGGYGVTRILDQLDFAPLAKDPKPILGYSDITALLAAAWRATGLVSFHGAMVANPDSMANGPAMDALQHALVTDPDRAPALPLEEGTAPHVIRPGRAEGRLVGGNLTLVQSLLATRHEIDTEGRILFLEDTGEAPYRVDRMLTQLRSAGHLHRCAGVILGDFHLDKQPQGSLDPEMLRVFRDRLEDLPCPVAYGFPFGHLPRAWTLPFGGMARLDARSEGALARLELVGPTVTGG